MDAVFVVALSRRHGIICPVGECKPQAKHALSGIDTMFLSESQSGTRSASLENGILSVKQQEAAVWGEKAKMADSCSDCERIELIKKQKAPYFVRESKTGYVVIGDNQRIKRHSLFFYASNASLSCIF